MSNESQLNINESIVAFSDVGLTNNPTLRHFDWSRNLNGLTVYHPKAEQHLIAPRSMLSIFNAVRSILADATTQIQVSYLADSTYRFKYTAGTDPRFATDNPLTFINTQITVTALPNQTVTMAAGAAVFTGVAGGSYIYIYNSNDTASPGFSVLNSGVWVVLSNNANTTLTLARPSGTSFSGTSEVVTLSAANNMINYVLSSVQVGDKMRVDAPFAVGSRSTYVVSNVTSKWVDVVSTTPIVSETLLMIQASLVGLTFYSASKRFTRVETDQRATVYFNGSTSVYEEIEPWSAGDRKLMGWQERIGPVWALDVFNLSNVPMVVNVFTAE